MAENQAPAQGLDPNRVLQLVQQDPTGKLLVHNAMLTCVVEDQQKVIQDLQKKLVDNTPTDSPPAE